MWVLSDPSLEVTALNFECEAKPLRVPLGWWCQNDNSWLLITIVLTLCERLIFNSAERVCSWKRDHRGRLWSHKSSCKLRFWFGILKITAKQECAYHFHFISFPPQANERRTERYYITNTSMQVAAAWQSIGLNKPHATKCRVVVWRKRRGRRIESSLDTYMIDKLESKDQGHSRQKYWICSRKVNASCGSRFCAINSKWFSSSSCEDFQYSLIILTASFC